jgi:peptidoglycan hydrolase-like protein with peptidoglycan-binding domain
MGARWKMRRAVVVAAGLLVVACSGKSAEMRAREQVEKVKEAIPDVEAKALAQKVTPEEVQKAQAALMAAHEYLGAVNGQLDAVTVNAIEAFQRAHGLKGNGILDEKTQRALEEVLAKK